MRRGSIDALLFNLSIVSIESVRFRCSRFSRVDRTRGVGKSKWTNSCELVGRTTPLKLLVCSPSRTNHNPATLHAISQSSAHTTMRRSRALAKLCACKATLDALSWIAACAQRSDPSIALSLRLQYFNRPFNNYILT